MLIGISNRTREMSAKLSCGEKEMIKCYIFGAIDSFCKNCKGQDFSVRILFGEENKDWHGTPMQKIYDYHISQGKTDKEAKNLAAKDAGYFLKKLLKEDERERTFKFTFKDTSNRYILLNE